MNPPKLTKEDALELIRISGKHIAEPVFILSIRGFLKDRVGGSGKNERGIYDDAMFLIGPNTYVAVNANTDPTRYHIGATSLIPGLHYYKKGVHHISSTQPYPAFRPDTPDESLPVIRDGEVGISKAIAINIHKGGYNSTSSEGCQTVYPGDWLQFQEAAYKAMDDAGQKWIGYLLIEK